MIYNSEIEIDVLNAKTYLKHLLDKKKRFELTEIRKTRSISQNNYQHLILSYFALNYGDKMEHVKLEIFKKLLSPDIFKTEFANHKTGEIREDWRSSKDLNTKEMTTAINRFLDYSVMEFGLRLPEPKDFVYLDHIKNEIKKNQQYL